MPDLHTSSHTTAYKFDSGSRNVNVLLLNDTIFIHYILELHIQQKHVVHNNRSIRVPYYSIILISQGIKITSLQTSPPPRTVRNHTR